MLTEAQSRQWPLKKNLRLNMRPKTNRNTAKSQQPPSDLPEESQHAHTHTHTTKAKHPSNAASPAKRGSEASALLPASDTGPSILGPELLG